jgi:hypothetical protein
VLRKVGTITGICKMINLKQVITKGFDKHDVLERQVFRVHHLVVPKYLSCRIVPKVMLDIELIALINSQAPLPLVV